MNSELPLVQMLAKGVDPSGRGGPALQIGPLVTTAGITADVYSESRRR